MTGRLSWAFMALAAMVCAACNTAAPTAETGSGATTSSIERPRSTSSTVSTVPEELLATQDFDLEPTRATGLITPTGVPVAVLGQAGNRSLVRTPCGAITFVSGGVELRDVDVVFDPGHGGPVATGAVGFNGLVEADLNLRVVEAGVEDLARRGIVAVSTRSASYPVKLEVRSAFADALGAELMVSVHHNAPNAFPSETPGTEVFVQSKSVSSRRLGGLLQAYVSAALAQFKGVRWTIAGDAGVMRVINSEGSDAYGIIRRPETPTALVELGYISNRDEASLFATPEYLEVAGAALADAVEAFLNSDEQGSGFVSKPRVFNPASAPSDTVCSDPVLE